MFFIKAILCENGHVSGHRKFAFQCWHSLFVLLVFGVN